MIKGTVMGRVITAVMEGSEGGGMGVLQRG